jgi:phosphatidylserine/phosphatidylglycerophosphate/cardiolipin synthase-like enzyme
MFRLLRKHKAENLQCSSLYNQNTFYGAFARDLRSCHDELIVESPFITAKRMETLLPVFKKLRRRNVRIIINTRNPDDHEGAYREQALNAVNEMQELGVEVLYTVGHHRKLAIIDRNIVWEGSLNILSFNDSCEIMRRIMSVSLAKELLIFTGLLRYLR